MKYLFAALPALLCLLLSAASPVTLPGGAVLDKLKFSSLPDKLSSLDGSMLVITVPPERKTGPNTVSAAVNLAPYRNKVVQFSIPLRAENVSVPEQKWNGVKFQLETAGTDGKPSYSGAELPPGSFDWRLATFKVAVTADTGILQLGLQQSSGKVEFDLSKLKIRILYSTDHDSYQAEYTPELKNRPRRRGVMLPQNDLTRNDLETIKRWNVNLVRFQFCRNWGKKGTDRDLADYDRWFEQRLNNLDWLLSEAPKYGIQVVVDLHTPPGGWQNPHNVMTMFTEPEYANHYLELWRKLAAHFKGNPGIWAYDLLNEPRALDKGGISAWELQQIAATLIREIDPETPILITTNWGGGTYGWNDFRPVELRNIIYQFHFYNPIPYTHQFIHEKREKNEPFRPYPGNIKQADKTEFWDRKRLRRELNEVLAFARKHNARIYVGEFSAIGWAPGADRYLADCIELFEEYGWDWSYHSFRESPFWNVEMRYDESNGFIPAPEGTPRQSVLLDYFRRNSSSSD